MLEVSFDSLPVVIRADLISARDQEWHNDFTYAAAAEACGQAIDAPEIMLHGAILLSPSTCEIGAIGGYAARI